MFRKASAGSAVSNIEFIAAALVLLLLEAFLFYRFLIGPQITAYDAVGAELAGRRIVLEKYQEQKTNAGDMERRHSELLEQIGEAEAKLPPTLHNEDVAILISRFAQETNVSVESVSFQERLLADLKEYAAGANAGGANAADTNAAGTKAGEPQNSAGEAGGMIMQSALYGDAPSAAGKTLSLQGVQISFSSEFHTAEKFIRLIEESERKTRVKSASLTRVQEGELKGVLNLEFAALSPDAEGGYPGVYQPGQFEGEPGRKESLFGKYGGFIEDNADPAILLLSGDDDLDPDFYIVLKAASSNETKVSYGVYPRVETELRSNVNNAVRAKLTISGDEDQFEYVYSLASYQKSEKRKLAAEEGKLRLKALSCQRIGDNDNVAVLLDVENNTELPFEVIVVNDDVLAPRLHLGITKGNVNVVAK